MLRMLCSLAVTPLPVFRFKSMGLKQYIQFRTDVGGQSTDEKERMESIAYEVSKDRATLHCCCLLRARRPYMYS